MKIILTPVIVPAAFKTNEATPVASPSDDGELVAINSVLESPTTLFIAIATEFVVGGTIVTPVLPVGTVMVLFPLERFTRSLCMGELAFELAEKT